VQRVTNTESPNQPLAKYLFAKDPEAVNKAVTYLQSIRAPEDVIKKVDESKETKKTFTRAGSVYTTYAEPLYQAIQYLKGIYTPEDVIKKGSQAYDNKIMYMINPDTGRPNLNGRDLSDGEIYLIAEIDTQTDDLSTEQILIMFNKLLQTDGNITDNDILNIVGEITEPNWLGKLTGGNPEKDLADSLNSIYHVTKAGYTLPYLDQIEREQNFNKAMSFFRMASQKKGKPVGEGGEVEEPTVPDDYEPFDYSSYPDKVSVGRDRSVSSTMSFDDWQANTGLDEMPLADVPGRDPLRPSEQYTGVALKEIRPDMDIVTNPTNPYDYKDMKTKQVFDQMGDPGASEYWYITKDSFLASIKSHVLKSNSITVIDLRFFTPEQVSQIENYIYSSGEITSAQRGTIWFIRFPS
jgi:hypothetical protein